MMKRLAAIILILCLILGDCAMGLAEGRISITKQPETQTVKKGGTVTYKFQARNMTGKTPITWYFTNPANGKVYFGSKIAKVKALKGLKVVHPNGQNLTLKNVPEAMHGWTIYARVGNKSSGVNTQTVTILIAGKELPGTETKAETKTTKKKSTKKTTKEAAATEASVEEAAATPKPAATPEPAGPIVIKGSKVELYALDKQGNMTGTASKELTFETGDADFFVRLPEGTEGTIQYLTVGGVRLTPDGEATGMSIRGWKSSATVKVKVQKPGAAATAEAPVDESTLVNVTCTNCRFTGWHNSFAESGKVPAGSTITVIASGGVLKKGYSINGGEAEHKDQATFQLVVTGDTTITMEKQK